MKDKCGGETFQRNQIIYIYNIPMDCDQKGRFKLVTEDADMEKKISHGKNMFDVPHI